jgi:DNA-binding MarR family transcriptional regulator
MFVVVQLHQDARRMTVFGPFGTAHAADSWASNALIAGTYFTKRVTSPLGHSYDAKGDHRIPPVQQEVSRTMPKKLPPLTANQRMALFVLAGGDQRIDQVSWYPLRPSQLQGLLYSLERRGLVDTVRMEGRARIWGLTAKGRAEVERLNAEGQEEDHKHATS